MRIHGLGILDDFIHHHAEAREQVKAWLSEVEGAEWKGPQDIKERYSTASFLSNNRVVFNIKGNKYRIAVQLSYKHQIVLILMGGTHAEYDRWKL
ncbi:MAG: type II toxin-antitoxin system HigB family toxin [Candidatus Binatia bacterium]